MKSKKNSQSGTEKSESMISEMRDVFSPQPKINRDAFGSKPSTTRQAFGSLPNKNLRPRLNQDHTAQFYTPTTNTYKG